MSSHAIDVIPRLGALRGAGLAFGLLTLGACGDSAEAPPGDGRTVYPIDADDGGDDASPDDHDGGSPDAGRDGSIGDAGPPGRDAAAADDAGTRPPPVCDPVAQTGCATGQRCNRTPAGLACTPAGATAPFARCEASADACVTGTTCAETNFGDTRCTQFCDPETLSGCPGAGQTCRLRSARDAFALCSFAHECSPLKQDCADPTQRCAWTLLGAFCITQTARVPDGGECASAMSCSAGSTCVDDGAGRTRCTRQCDPDVQPSPCSSGMACEAYAEVWPQALGLCRPPQ